MCKCQVDSGAGSILPTETGFFSYKQQHEDWRLACQVKVKENIEMRIPESVLGIKNGNVLWFPTGIFQLS